MLGDEDGDLFNDDDDELGDIVKGIYATLLIKVASYTVLLFCSSTKTQEGFKT